MAQFDLKLAKLFLIRLALHPAVVVVAILVLGHDTVPRTLETPALP
jgi:hypothetical protein